jgi:hypothetical protein
MDKSKITLQVQKDRKEPVIKKCEHCHKRFKVTPGCVHCRNCKYWWCIDCIEYYDDDIDEDILKFVPIDSNCAYHYGLKIGKYGECVSNGFRCDFCNNRLTNKKLFRRIIVQKKYIKNMKKQIIKLQNIADTISDMKYYNSNSPEYNKVKIEFEKLKYLMEIKK